MDVLVTGNAGVLFEQECGGLLSGQGIPTTVTFLAVFDVLMQSRKRIARPAVLELLRFPVDHLRISSLVLRMTDNTAFIMKTMQTLIRLYPFSDFRVAVQAFPVWDPFTRRMALGALIQTRVVLMGTAESSRRNQGFQNLRVHKAGEGR
jgi:hypothetical protein